MSLSVMLHWHRFYPGDGSVTTLITHEEYCEEGVMTDNLPPGVSIRDIPGNRPMDEYFEDVMQNVTEEDGIEAEAAALEGWGWFWRSIEDSWAEGYSAIKAASVIEDEIKRRRGA